MGNYRTGFPRVPSSHGRKTTGRKLLIPDREWQAKIVVFLCVIGGQFFSRSIISIWQIVRTGSLSLRIAHFKNAVLVFLSDFPLAGPKFHSNFSCTACQSSSEEASSFSSLFNAQRGTCESACSRTSLSRWASSSFFVFRFLNKFLEPCSHDLPPRNDLLSNNV